MGNEMADLSTNKLVDAIKNYTKEHTRLSSLKGYEKEIVALETLINKYEDAYFIRTGVYVYPRVH